MIFSSNLFLLTFSFKDVFIILLPGSVLGLLLRLFTKNNTLISLVFIPIHFLIVYWMLKRYAPAVSLKKSVIVFVIAAIVAGILSFAALILVTVSFGESISRKLIQESKPELSTFAPPAPPTSLDYSNLLVTEFFAGGDFSIMYPITWKSERPTGPIGLPGDVMFIFSPYAQVQLNNGLTTQDNGYDVKVEWVDTLNQVDFIKGEHFRLAGKFAYRATFKGSVKGVVIEDKGFYLISFGPNIDDKLQEEILKHVNFAN
jgi:hypothetical protein